MSEVNIILTDKEDGTLGIRILSDAPEDSGASILAKMFLEYVGHLQDQEQAPKIITGE
jgi:hypothetical protein